MANKTRVLVVEDTESWQDIFREALEEEGHEVKTAGSLEKANQILDRQAFDVAIVDIRLSEGDSIKNTDGMEVLKKIRDGGDPTSIIVVSGFATVGLTRDAFRKFKVLDFIEKDQFEDPAFRKIVQQGIEEARSTGYGDISLSAKLLSEPELTQPKRSFLSGSPEDREEILKEIFQSCWPLSDTPSVNLRLVETWDGDHIVQIVGWSKGIGEAVVARLGPRDVIQSESQNYNKYIKDLTKNIRHMEKVGPFYRSDLGGLLYIQKGAEYAAVRDFTTFYYEEDIYDVIRVLNSTFRRAYNLYSNRGIDYVKVDLSTIYRSVVEKVVKNHQRELEEEERFLQELDEKERRIYLQKREEINPVEFVNSQKFIFESPVAVVHGDLHNGNILIDSRNQVWLLGFYDTGVSDILLTDNESRDSVAFLAHQLGKRNLLHDFATMEVSIRKTLLNLSADTLEEFDRVLTSPKEFGEPLSFPQTSSNTQLNKAFQAIARIRELAFEMVEFDGDLQLYYAEMLHQLLRVYLHTPEYAEKAPIWKSASRLAERLEKWH